MRQALFACCGAAVGSFGSIALYDRWQASTINHPPQSSIDYGQIEQIVQSAVGAQRNSSSQEANIAWRPPKSKVTAENAVTTICLTGGPCGGKSSALDTLVRRLEEAKYQVFISPETPTVLKELCNCGYPYQSDVPRRLQLDWERNKMNLQGAAEDTLISIASLSGKKTVVLCDRGMSGSAAYMEGDEQQQEDEFQEILDEQGWKHDELLNRYDLVIHLETAAIDTEVYDNASKNNIARHESKSQAIEQDMKTQKAWANHHNVKLVRNKDCKDPELLAQGIPEFDQKKNRVVREAFEFLGLVPPTFNERKFLIDHVSSSELKKQNIKFTQFEITQTFLSNGDRVVEKRGRGDTWSYTLCERENTGAVHTQRLSRRAYSDLIQQKDPNRRQVKKKRTVFLLNIASVGRDVKHQIEEFYSESGSINTEVLSLEQDDHGVEYAPPAFLHKFVREELKDHSKVDLSTLAGK